MIRAKKPFSRDDEQLHGYSVGVVVDGNTTTVSSFAGQPFQMPVCSMTVQFPGTGPGVWNCAAQDDACMTVIDFGSGRYYFVKKDLVGVDGQIETIRYDDDIISGTFSGTLGYWDYDMDPEVVPPASTISIEGGVFKHAGMGH